MNRYREPVTHLSTALLLLALAPQVGGEGPASRYVPSIHAVRFFIAAQDTTPRPGVPVEPVSAILDAFDHHDVVAVGDPPGNEQAHAFRLALIRDPRFVAAVDDIVVEWGNALYQDVMDRFVGGDDVSDAELREVWRNTTQPG